MSVGTCDGRLPKGLSEPLGMALGTVFYVRVGHEMDGSLDYPVPAPGSDVLKLTARKGSIVQYHAIHPGATSLIAHGTTYCVGIDPRRGSCPILEVRVRRS